MPSLTIDTTWLPPFMPPEALTAWEIHPRLSGDGFVTVHGTSAYEFVCRSDGMAVEILAYVDGICTYYWRRDPLYGVWPSEYTWQSVEIYGQGLVQ